MVTEESSRRRPMQLRYDRSGAGKPLLLLHGLGGSRHSWAPLVPALAAQRDVITVDLPGFGETPPLNGDVSIATLADAVTDFLLAMELTGIDTVGSSMGARLVLELARRGVIGTAIALNPGGFWSGWQRIFFAASIKASVALVRILQPLMPLLTGNPLGRTLLLAQFSARPWRLPGKIALTEMRSFAAARSFDPLLESLVNGPRQRGFPDEPAHPIVIVWGRQDRVCLPRQAKNATELFPFARLVWFENCGHFPQWDQPRATATLILETTA